MEFVVLQILAALLGACFADIGCRRALTRRQRPGWHLALLSACAVAMLTAGLDFLVEVQEDLLRPDRWGASSKGTFGIGIMVASVWMAIVALFPSVIVVSSARTRFRLENQTSRHAATAK